MNFLVDIIPPRWRKLAYGIAAAAGAAVAVLGKTGVIPSDGADQIAGVIGFLLGALATANTPKG
jgi:hypothetical protein